MKPWTREEDQIVLDGIRRNLSRRQIADMLPDRNRNSVIGRATRLAQWAAAGAEPTYEIGRPLKTTRLITVRKSSKTKIVTGVDARILAEARERMEKIRTEVSRDVVLRREDENRRSEGYPLLELPGDGCKFIMKNDLYCGSKVESVLQPYCEHHKRIVYTKPKPRDRSQPSRPIMMGRKRGRY